MKKIICVCGTRPNFVKIASIMKALIKNGNFEISLVHTGQHYDDTMSRLFFDQLNIPRPDYNLEVGSGNHISQISEIMVRFETVVNELQPDFILVVGDVNSTLACGIVAVKLGIKLIHVEAGLRSFDRTMPEEINRILTDSISDLLFVSEPSGIENLTREGIDQSKVHFVGNVVIDTLLENAKKSQKSSILDDLNVIPKEYGIITLHRPGNVDNEKNLAHIINAIKEIQQETTLIFPVHPRTLKNIHYMGFEPIIHKMSNLIIIDPLGYLDFLCLMSNALFVMTDSGGIQEETTILGVNCLTLRENTERPVTITSGTNRLVRLSTDSILENYHAMRHENGHDTYRIPKLWDGKTAERIIDIIDTYE